MGLKKTGQNWKKTSKNMARTLFLLSLYRFAVKQDRQKRIYFIYLNL